jgi:transcription elongation factor
MRNNKDKQDIAIGDIIKFHSGNFEGKTGIVKEVNFNSNDKRAIYGYLHTVLFPDDSIGYIEKGEHWHFE